MLLQTCIYVLTKYYNVFFIVFRNLALYRVVNYLDTSIKQNNFLFVEIYVFIIGDLCFRMHMLEKSCDALPYNLALVERPKDVANIETISERCSNNELVIGHSRLCKVHSDPNACFVESGK